MLNIKSATNPKYVSSDNSVIELQVQFVEFGEQVFPFGATADDVEEHGRVLYAKAIAGEFGAIADWVAPTPDAATQPQPISQGAQTL